MLAKSVAARFSTFPENIDVLRLPAARAAGTVSLLDAGNGVLSLALRRRHLAVALAGLEDETSKRLLRDLLVLRLSGPGHVRLPDTPTLSHGTHPFSFSLSSVRRPIESATWCFIGSRSITLVSGSWQISIGTGVTAANSGQVRSIAIDNYVASAGLPSVDFLKMDIEGAEGPALVGARETIKKYRPRLGISVYDSLQELFELPWWLMHARSDSGGVKT